MNKLTNLQKRIIAAVIGASLIISLIMWNRWSFLSFGSTLALLCYFEFFSLLKKADYKPTVLLGMTIGSVFLSRNFILEANIFDTHRISSLYNLNQSLLYIDYALLLLFFIMFIIKLYDKLDKRPFVNISLSILGLIYIVIPFSCFVLMSFVKGVYLYQIPLGTLYLLWASDTGAYFAGKNFGKNKLFPRISPKKTWEGSIGGLIVSLLVAIILSFVFTQVSSWKWFAMSLIIVVFGSMGDLVESMLKRSLHIKDSGSIIPGHGGFLDRFDGLLLAAPFLMVFLKLFEKF